MGKIGLYQINMTSELVMSCVLLFLLITCILQKKKVVTIKALIVLIAADLMLMLCQIAEWVLMIAGSQYETGEIPMFYTMKKLTYSLDYVLYYCVSVAFYNYIKSHIKDMYAQNDNQTVTSKDKWIKVLIAWGVLVFGVFVWLIGRDWFYYIDATGNEMFHLTAYLLIYLLGTLGTLSSVYTLVKHRIILGRTNFFLLMMYNVVPTVLVIFDLRAGTCITYLMMTFYAFVLYIHVDLRTEKILAEREAQIMKQEKELTELNTQIMLSQMQPHFLYNTLTTISGLCYLEGAGQAKDVVDKFADYFRENLDSLGEEKYISFEKELKHIETYLWIEQVRFAGSLEVEYDVQVKDFRIPSLSIQPLVENAVKHGIRKKKGGGTVKISTRETNEEYLISVEDDGAGFDLNSIPDDGRSHIGIENIKKRLHILCNGTCDIISKEHVGTTVSVHIPKEKKY